MGCTLGLAGCSLRLNDKVTKPITNVQVGGGCLSQAGDVLAKFENGTLTADEHASFYACANKAIDTFLANTTSRSADRYEPAELGRFLTKYFLNGKPISPQLVGEAMALKAAFLGGSADNLSREDLRNLQALLARASELTGALRPVMPISVQSFRDRNFTAAQLEDTLRLFTTSVARFGDAMKGSQGTYSLTRLTALSSAIGNFLYPAGVPADHWTTRFSRYAAVLPPAKAILVSEPAGEIALSDWPRVYHLAPRYYATMLRGQFYLSSPLSLVEGGGLGNVDRLFSEFVVTFDYVLKQHPGSVITSDEIDAFTTELEKQKMIPFSADTARQAVRMLFGRLLGERDVKILAEKTKFSITTDSIANFRENVRFLLEGLHANEALFRSYFGDDYATRELTAAEIAAVPDATLLRETALKSALSAEAVKAVKATPRDARTVFSGDTWNVVIPERGTAASFSYHHMLKMHLLRSLDRLLLKAYGTPGVDALTEKQETAFVNDVFPIARDLGLVDDSMRASISKRMLEATLFLYSSNGESGITMSEALEMEALLASTLTRAGAIHKEIAAACNATKTDAAGRLLIPAACYRSRAASGKTSMWAMLPGLENYLSHLPGDQRLAMFDTMASFLRKGRPANADYTLADTQSFSQLPAYVEMLFARFDQDGDGLFNNAEAAVAYPVFRPFLAEKANAKGYTKEDDYKAIYNFLLAYRELPTDDALRYELRRHLLGDKSFTADRGQVLEIFAKLLSL